MPLNKGYLYKVINGREEVIRCPKCRYGLADYYNKKPKTCPYCKAKLIWSGKVQAKSQA